MRKSPHKPSPTFVKAMKNFTYCAFLLAMLMGLNLTAQSPAKGKVSGQVLDSQNKILEFTTVTLLKAKDSTLVKGALGDANGRFEFENVHEGRYLVSVSQMGYQKFYSPAFSVVSADEIKMEVIQLKEASKELAEVKVVAAKPFIEQQLDKTVVNVENSIVSAGSTALEVLEKSPGITVDSDGKISLKGKQAVLVMIDGKPTYMSATDLANYLRNMQASQMEKIEIMTNPPAKYDAAGNAGIINIRLKKNQNMGLNGSINGGLGYGRYMKENAGLNLNYRQGKMNVFGSYNFRHNQSFQDLTINRALL